MLVCFLLLLTSEKSDAHGLAAAFWILSPRSCSLLSSCFLVAKHNLCSFQHGNILFYKMRRWTHLINLMYPLVAILDHLENPRRKCFKVLDFQGESHKISVYGTALWVCPRFEDNIVYIWNLSQIQKLWGILMPVLSVRHTWRDITRAFSLSCNCLQFC